MDFSWSTISLFCSSTFHLLKAASVTSDGAPVAIGDGLGDGVRETAEETEFGFGCVIDEWKVAETGIARVAHPSAGRGAREALPQNTKTWKGARKTRTGRSLVDRKGRSLLKSSGLAHLGTLV